MIHVAGYHEYRGDNLSIVGDSLSAVGVFSTMEILT